MMRVIGFVPARGGSKGLPGKNLARVGKLSLVGRSVRCADLASSVDQCIVSSDDDDILLEAERCGAVPLRTNSALAQDETPTATVLLDFLDDELARGVDAVVLLQPTSPFRAPSDVDACVELVRGGQSATTVCENEHPTEWIFDLDATGHLAIPKTGLPNRRQSAAQRVRLTGSVYAWSVDRLRSGGPLIDHGTVAVVVPRHRAIDIDDRFDLEVAQALAGSDYDPLAGREF